jgi:peptidase M23-like protein
MRAAIVACLLLPLAANTLAARGIVLTTPIACDLENDCFVQQYVDHDPSDAAMDFRCSNLSYDTHKGTDFALRSIAQMVRGVDITAAAPGTVKATRDGMPDQVVTAENVDELEGRDCGNGVMVDHGGGWTTQYCHMKRGSISVRQGDRVNLSTVIGQVGLSGRTQFPHLELTLRKAGEVVDPFDPDGEITCGAPSTDTLWQDPPPYRPGGVLSAGFSDGVPEFDAIKAGEAHQSTLTADAPAIVLFGYMFGSQAGDLLQLKIEGPEGTFLDQNIKLDRGQAQLFRAVGKKRTTPAWPQGAYAGTVTLHRDGQVINSQQQSLVVE